ncbi:MAG: Stp1/IreP family PP2C-type Ser/Thr phosphatase [Bacillota bacterium]|nr:Stp1/IreP family PP2C-type Ser/Thr phosphatase [Bacillota bacterium]
MKYTFISDKGISRDNNEDFILISEELSLFLLADGMGGHLGGEIASEQACRFIMDEVYADKKGLKENPVRVFESAVQKANAQLLEMAVVNPELEGMGTTIVILHMEEDDYTICHLGDSRAYKFDGKKLIRLTKDHSFVQQMIDDGIITEKEAKNHKYRNVITRSLGFPLEYNLEFTKGQLQEGEILLLCTDGLHDYVDLKKVEKLLKKHGIEAIDEIAGLANEAGGKDNCSLVCVSK